MLVNASRANTLRQTSALIAALSLCSPIALRAQTGTGKGTSVLERTVDATIKPGDDFFAYANGAWLKAAEIPQGKARWNAGDEIKVLTQKRIAQMLDDARNAPPRSPARKVADFREAWLNEAVIESRGRTPLKSQLDSIDIIADKRALVRAIARSMRADVDPLNWGVFQSSSVLGLAVQESIHGEKTNVAFLVQGGLGLADRERYINAEPRMRALRTTYRTYISALLSFGGSDHADQRAEAVLSLETAIAQTHATQETSANDRNADSVWTRADFARRAPGIDWSAYLDAAGLSKQQTFVAWQPGAITGVAALIASQPLEVWKDYLRFHVVAEYAQLLPRDIAERALALRAVISDQSHPAPHAQRALEATQLAMSDAIGKMYVDRYFPVEAKARVQRIVGNVAAAFIKRVEANNWMSPATRTLALAKLKTLYIGIGYPEKWQDHSDLVIDATDAVGNARRVADRNYAQALAKLGQPVDRKEWFMAPQTAGALLVFQLNSYVFTAAFLQAPKFDATASDAAAYGAIGAMIGHDVVHYVDVLGAEYDLSGAMRRWWTPQDSSRYQKLSDALVTQYSSYHPFPDAAVDGKMSERENIADLGGLASAFDAYRVSLGAKITDTKYVRQHDREFFIAFAQGWRTKMNDVAMRAQLTNDHAPEMYRVFTVRNIDAWYDAFNVRPGERMFLPPKARVRIW